MYSITLSSLLSRRETDKRTDAFNAVCYSKTEAGTSCGGDWDGLNPAGDTWGGGDTVGGFSEDAST